MHPQLVPLACFPRAVRRLVLHPRVEATRGTSRSRRGGIVFVLVVWLLLLLFLLLSPLCLQLLEFQEYRYFEYEQCFMNTTIQPGQTRRPTLHRLITSCCRRRSSSSCFLFLAASAACALRLLSSSSLLRIMIDFHTEFDIYAHNRISL